MSEIAYVVGILFFFLLTFLALIFEVDRTMQRWLHKRAKDKEPSDVSKEAERAEGSSSLDIWEEIERARREELHQQIEAREQEYRIVETTRRMRELRDARESMRANLTHVYGNTTQVDYDYHHMGSWNMADSPNTHRASAYNQGDVVRLHFPEDQRNHIRQLLHGQVVRLDSPREDYAGEWYCSLVNPTTMPEAFRVRRVCVREYFFVPAAPEPDTFVVGDVVRLEFPEHERFIHGDYSWQRRQTTEGLLHGQYVILRHQHPGAPYLWDVSILNKADCPPSLIGRQLVAREKYFIKKQPAPAKAYPKKVKLTEGGLPKL